MPITDKELSSEDQSDKAQNKRKLSFSKVVPSQTNDRVFNQIKNNVDSIIISLFANHAEYYKQAAFENEETDLTVVILPSVSSVQREANSHKDSREFKKIACLTSDLFPNQARHLLEEIAKGEYRLLFVTPESFLYWFSSGLNSSAIQHYKKMEETDLGKQVLKNSKKVLERLDRVVLCEFELFSRTNAIFKEKYQEAITLVKKLKKPILGLSCNCSKETVQHFMRFFPNTAVIQESFRLKGVSLKTKYCFSRLDKRKHLAQLLKDKKPTLVYVPQNEDLSELINFLRDKLPDTTIRALHKALPMEQRAEALDYFLNDPCPIFIASSSLMEGIARPDIYRLIHYSVPASLTEFYKDIHVLKSTLNNNESSGKYTASYKESHLLICEDDFNPSPEENNFMQVKYNRDGFQVDFKKLARQSLDWISNTKGCRWQNLEQVLTSNLQEQNQCGICDLCVGEKPSILSSTSMFILKSKLK